MSKKDTRTIDELQKEIQRIHEELIVPERKAQDGEDYISISLSPQELDDLINFLDCFAYS